MTLTRAARFASRWWPAAIAVIVLLSNTITWLLRGPLESVLERAPYVRYIFVKRADNVFDGSPRCSVDCPENAGLRRELLASEPATQRRLTLLADIRFQRGNQVEPFARLFEVLPSPARRQAGAGEEPEGQRAMPARPLPK